eukprot:tig00020553_g10672.t1
MSGWASHTCSGSRTAAAPLADKTNVPRDRNDSHEHVKELKEEIMRLRDKLEREEDRNKRLERQRDKAEADCKLLVRERDEADADLQKEQERARRLQRERDGAKDDLRDEAERRRKAARDAEASRLHTQEAEARAADASKELQAARAAQQASAAEAAAAKQRAEAAERRAATAESSARAAERELEEVRRQAEAAGAARQQLEEEREKAKASLAKAREEAGAARQRLEEERTRREAAETRAGEAEARAEEAGARAEAAEARAAAAERQFSETSDRLASAEAALRTVSAEWEEHQEAEEKLRAEAEALQKQYDDACDTNGYLQAKLEEAIEEGRARTGRASAAGGRRRAFSVSPPRASDLEARCAPQSSDSAELPMAKMRVSLSARASLAIDRASLGRSSLGRTSLARASFGRASVSRRSSVRGQSPSRGEESSEGGQGRRGRLSAIPSSPAQTPEAPESPCTPKPAPARPLCAVSPGGAITTPARAAAAAERPKRPRSSPPSAGRHRSVSFLNDELRVPGHAAAPSASPAIVQQQKRPRQRDDDADPEASEREKWLQMNPREFQRELQRISALVLTASERAEWLARARDRQRETKRQLVDLENQCRRDHFLELAFYNHVRKRFYHPNEDSGTFYVIADTNIYLHCNWERLLGYSARGVLLIVPGPVEWELDGLRKPDSRQRERDREAACKAVSDIQRHVTGNVRIPALRTALRHERLPLPVHGPRAKNNDDLIIECAAYFSVVAESPERAIIVSHDKAVVIRAASFGICALELAEALEELDSMDDGLAAPSSAAGSC